jgi:uncharacterized protein
MKLDLDRQPDGHFEIPVSERLTLEEIGGEPTTFAVEGNLRVDKLETRVVVLGELQAYAEVSCDRCLRDFTLEVTVPLEILILRGGPGEEPEDSEASIIHQKTGEVDLDEPLREALVLAQPLQRVCRADCPGICPGCGADLTTGECRCEPEPDPQWQDLPE